MPFIIFFLFLPQLSSFSLHSAISLHLLDWQELSQRQTMLMNQGCVSINVFLSPSWWESYTAANFALRSFFFFSLPPFLALETWKESGFSTYQIPFYQTAWGAFSDMVDHSQEAQFQPEQADKGHWKTIHSDYVGTQSHMDLNHMSIKTGLPSLTLCDLTFKYCCILRTAAGTSHR